MFESQNFEEHKQTIVVDLFQTPCSCKGKKDFNFFSIVDLVGNLPIPLNSTGFSNLSLNFIRVNTSGPQPDQNQ